GADADALGAGGDGRHRDPGVAGRRSSRLLSLGDIDSVPDEDAIPARLLYLNRQVSYHAWIAGSADVRQCDAILHSITSKHENLEKHDHHEINFLCSTWSMAPETRHPVSCCRQHDTGCPSRSAEVNRCSLRPG